MRNPKNIRAFLAVARCGSIGQSAAILQRTQSAISRSVQELERDVGVALFERHSHGMALTASGRVLLPRAAAAFAELAAASAAFAAALPEGACFRTAPIFTLSLTLQRLHVLTELAEQNSMAAVASALGLSQPAVSQTVREIETSVGAVLFTRAGGRTSPTALGAVLASHTRRALTQLRVATDEVVAVAGDVPGKVIVGSLSLGRAKLLPLAIARLLSRYPDLTIHTEEGSYGHLAWLLREGEIDFIVGALRPPEHTERFCREVVWTDRLAVIARAGHPHSHPAMTLAALAGCRWVLPGHGTSTRELLETALQLGGLPPAAVQVETANLTILLGLLLETDMITAASPSLFHRELEAGSITAFPLDLAATAQPIGIYRRAGAVPSGAAGHLMELVREIGAS